MNIDDKAKLDHILVQANIFIPESPPEPLGAVRLAQFMLYVQRASPPHIQHNLRKSDGSQWLWWGFWYEYAGEVP